MTSWTLTDSDYRSSSGGSSRSVVEPLVDAIVPRSPPPDQAAQRQPADPGIGESGDGDAQPRGETADHQGGTSTQIVAYPADHRRSDRHTAEEHHQVQRH